MKIFQNAHSRANIHWHAENYANCIGEVSPFCRFGVCALFGLVLGQGVFGDAAASIPDEVLVIEFIELILLVRFVF